jgi:hypothetical protein
MRIEITKGSEQRAAFNNGVFINGVVNNAFFFQAKILDGAAKLGINGSSVVKLSICDSPSWSGEKECFNYESGMDFVKTPVTDEMVDEITKALTAYFKKPVQPRDEWFPGGVILKGRGFPKAED